MGLPRKTSPHKTTEGTSVPPKAKAAVDAALPAGGEAGQAAVAAGDPEAFTKAVLTRYPRIIAKLAE